MQGIYTYIPETNLWAVRPVQILSACTRVTFTLYHIKIFVLVLVYLSILMQNISFGVFVLANVFASYKTDSVYCYNTL